MDDTDNWLKLKKDEWKKSIEEAKELGTVDSKLLDVMSSLLEGIKVRECRVEKE